MKAYLSILRMQLLRDIQYRAAAIAGLFTQIFFGFGYIFLYRALFGASNPEELARTVTYVWVQQAFFRLIFSVDGTLRTQIVSGSIAYELCRPLGVYSYWGFRSVAHAAVYALMRAVPMLTVAALLPAPWGIAPPAGAGALLAFCLTLLMGVLATGALNMIFTAIILWTMDYRGIVTVATMLHSFLAGNQIPLTLLPAAWQRFILLTPSAQALDVPIRFYTGELALSALPGQLAVQLFWVLALGLIGWLMWRRGLRRLVLQGG